MQRFQLIEQSIFLTSRHPLISRWSAFAESQAHSALMGAPENSPVTAVSALLEQLLRRLWDSPQREGGLSGPVGHTAFTGKAQPSKPATRRGHFDLETCFMCELPFLCTKLTLVMTQSNDSAMEASPFVADGWEISLDFTLKAVPGIWTLPLS